MADRRLRELERASAEGDLDAGARLLLERVRIGDLAPGRLRLAAYLGLPAATLAAPEVTAPEDLIAWVEGVQEVWGG